MKKVWILWIIAAVLLIGGIGVMADGNVASGIVAIIAAAVLGFLGYRAYKRKDEPAKQAEQPAAARCFRTKAAGVTFDNEDGTSRQDILRACPKNDIDDYETVNGSVELIEYRGEPAFRIFIGRDCIGSIPKDDMPKMLKIKDKISSVTVTPDEFTNDEGKRLMRADVNIWYCD